MVSSSVTPVVDWEPGPTVAGLAVGGDFQLGCGTLLPEHQIDGQAI